MSEKKALTKFLRCVEWSDLQEAKQATVLMGKWEMIDVCDALELLSPLFECEEVRAYAVSILERAEDEELQGTLSLRAFYAGMSLWNCMILHMQNVFTPHMICYKKICKSCLLVTMEGKMDPSHDRV
ncbi:hypothetical protein Droror1_Dr00014473 [Drosera rotundifolia]